MRVLTATTVGPIRLRNRIATTAHTTLFADADGYPSARLIEYQAARARGGVGLIISSGVRVRPASDIPNRLSASRDECIPRFAELAERIRSEGARFFVQLSETGRVHGTLRNPPVSPSPIPWRPFAPMPHQLSTGEAATIVAEFGAAARRIAAAGADGIELQLGHGTLLQQFLSPASNHRRDRYGGSSQARLQFPREVLQAVRSSVPTGTALSLRISADEFVDDGLHVEDMLEIVADLVEGAPVDLLNVSHSAYTDSSDSLTTQVADMSYPAVPFRHFGARFRTAFPHIPVLIACRVDTLELAEQLVEQGAADLVGMTRAHIADPDIVRKHLDGNSGTIRHCIACNQGCLGNLERGVPITCTVNPGVGFEAETDRYRQLTARLPSGTDQVDSGESGPTSDLVLVVGAGPAGLEAAIECRLAGLRVLVVERELEAGGQLRLASSVRGRELWRRAVDDQLDLARSLGVDIDFGTSCSATTVIRTSPASVVLATGSREAELAPLAGVRHLDIEEAVRSLPALREQPAVLVEDELGGWPAVALASDLCAAGVDVRLVTSNDQLAPLVTLYSKFGLLDRLRKGRARVHLMRKVEAGPNGLSLVDVVSGDREPIPEVGTVITAQARTADDTLAQDLRDAGYAGDIHLVGDALAPRTALEAIADGRAVAGLVVARSISAHGSPT
ncbi:MAG: FAD-binding protein [Actinophytocola sp.]|uniref:oxidoreductase n=1 Tax=Actinophytocola sp. TaxID=1872138 RepID=UPI001320DD94|nr:FAD-dependent oxidoreductase [Actinophytocola sp.]MPZ82500.1 FAD-binding protein [Actinophytocola sp.]